MRPILHPLLAFLLLAASGASFGQGGLFHPAENQVELAIIDVKRSPSNTEVKIVVTAQTRICWHKSGPDSPYLVAGKRNYRLITSEGAALCPDYRIYDRNETMVLRFEPLPNDVQEFSLVEGEGGENQMQGKFKREETFLSFLNIKLK